MKIYKVYRAFEFERDSIYGYYSTYELAQQRCRDLSIMNYNTPNNYVYDIEQIEIDKDTDDS